MTLRLVPDLLLTERGWRSGQAVAVAGGRIAAIEPTGRSEPGDVALADKALLPGTVNAHCHTFQSLLRGLTRPGERASSSSRTAATRPRWSSRLRTARTARRPR